MKPLGTVTGLGALVLLAACGGRERVLGGREASHEKDGGSGGGTPDTGAPIGSGGSSGQGAASGGDTSAGGTESGGATGAGATGASGATLGCAGSCCPVDPQCYSSPAERTAQGAECLARIDNSPSHIQLRRTWLHSAKPLGFTIPIVDSSLDSYTQLQEPRCNTPGGAGTYVQAFDIDNENGEARFGYTQYAPNVPNAVTGGLCFADVGMGADSGNSGWHDIADAPGGPVAFDFALPAEQMSPSTGYPHGLPAPMPQPWKMAPVKAKRLDTDFNLTSDRQTLLAQLAADGELRNYTGVYFYDEAAGSIHVFAPLSFELIYDAPLGGATTAVSFILVPIREAEIRLKFTDPAHPNCVGRYASEALDPSAGCVASDPSQPAWRGVTNPAMGEGDATANGYSLITEVEQVYSRQLQRTLCVVFPTLDESISAGWATQDKAGCRWSPQWNPTAPDNAGIPMGDWCARTNSPATATCHDAYRIATFEAYQAFKLKTADCPAL